MSMKPVEVDEETAEDLRNLKTYDRVQKGFYRKMMDEFVESGKDAQAFECESLLEAHKVSMSLSRIVPKGVRVTRRKNIVYIVKQEGEEQE